MTPTEFANRLDPRTVRRAFDRAAAHYERNAGLQREVADELIERLAAVRIDPAVVADLGCGTGHASRALVRMYPGARVYGVDFAPAMLRAFDRGWWPRRRPVPLCADLVRLPFADASVDVLFSSLAFQWIDDLPTLFAELRRVLRPEGVLMFSSFGPDTLMELRTAWAAVDDGVHVNRFPDMHDVGDALLGAGLRDPVMDVDRLTRAYADVRALMRSIKSIGAGNAATERSRGLTGRGVLERLDGAYERRDPDGRPLASWEVVYGHAWGAPIPRVGHGNAGEFAIPIDAIGGRVRRGSD
ncbi:MAG: malonyl-ACP O-methyltransferase BioC [Halofilum sp. (in: g-proteobacteria)]|nr:malonyl-ACP O-methyltransferase BioC [Halofilum sp. (in: g-proteobacteria)]